MKFTTFLFYLSCILFYSSKVIAVDIILDEELREKPRIYEYTLHESKNQKIEDFSFILKDKVVFPNSEYEYKEPYLIGILLDVSGSIQKKGLQDLKEKSLQFLSQLSNQDYITLWSFADEIKQEIEVSKNNYNQLKSNINQFTYRGNWTRLYDALLTTQQELNDLSLKLNRKSVLLLITDGIDEGSKSSLEDIHKIIRILKLPILIYILKNEKPEQIEQSEHLKKLSSLSNGVFSTNSIEDISKWLTQQQSKKVLTFKLPSKKDFEFPYFIWIWIKNNIYIFTIISFLFLCLLILFIFLVKRSSRIKNQQFEEQKKLEIEEEFKSAPPTPPITKRYTPQKVSTSSSSTPSKTRIVNSRTESLLKLRGENESNTVSCRVSRVQKSLQSRLDENENDSIARKINRPQSSLKSRLDYLNSIRDEPVEYADQSHSFKLNKSFVHNITHEKKSLKQLSNAIEELNNEVYASDNIQYLLTCLHHHHLKWSDLFLMIPYPQMYLVLSNSSNIDFLKQKNIEKEICNPFLYNIGKKPETEIEVESENWKTFCDREYSKSQPLTFKNKSIIQQILHATVTGQLSKKAPLVLTTQNGQVIKDIYTHHIEKDMVRFSSNHKFQLGTQYSLETSVIEQNTVNVNTTMVEKCNEGQTYLYEMHLV